MNSNCEVKPLDVSSIGAEGVAGAEAREGGAGAEAGEGGAGADAREAEAEAREGAEAGAEGTRTGNGAAEAREGGAGAEAGEGGAGADTREAEAREGPEAGAEEREPEVQAREGGAATRTGNGAGLMRTLGVGVNRRSVDVNGPRAPVHVDKVEVDVVAVGAVPGPVRPWARLQVVLECVRDQAGAGTSRTRRVMWGTPTPRPTLSSATQRVPPRSTPPTTVLVIQR